jgi:hypothetical protein
MHTTTTSTRRRRLAGAALALLLLAGGACSKLGTDDGDSQASMKMSASEDAGTLAGASGSAAATGAGGQADTAGTVGAPLPATLGQDRVVKTAALEVEVADGGFAKAFSKVPTIAAGVGGFVASSNSVSGDDGHPSAGSLVVRVPADRFDDARRQLIGLGDLRSEQLQGEDVGGKLTDLDARLRNLRSQEEAIRLLMTKTGTIGETIEVQRQLSTVREQIEQLAGEQARLQDAVALSTITLSLAEPGVALDPGKGSPLGDAVRRAVDGAEGVLTGVIVALGYLVPHGLLLAVGWLVPRPFLGARRRPSTATAGAATAAAP